MSYINLLDIIYPVGSFYFSTECDSPSQIIGGNWEQIDGAVIRAASTDGNSTINYIGNDSCTLTISQIPSHNHGNSVHYLPWNSNKVTTSNRLIVNDQPIIVTWSTQIGDGQAYLGGVNVGGGEAHSIVQRSFNCYIWRRIS